MDACIRPRSSTIANQLEGKASEMARLHGRHERYVPASGSGRNGLHEKATKDSQYATKHNPFVYFHSISEEDCKANDVPLNSTQERSQPVDSTPNLSFIVPNLCNDGHDDRNGKCADNKTPGGLVAIDSFLRHEVPIIMNSKAYQQDGMLIVTFDEADIEGEDSDASSCCGEPAGPNTRLPGMFGLGGGK